MKIERKQNIYLSAIFGFRDSVFGIQGKTKNEPRTQKSKSPIPIVFNILSMVKGYECASMKYVSTFFCAPEGF
ncbi:MAG: hypothetical protein QME42_07440 [bacterium]|nr:hypothetical protein [bacterium]